MLLQDYLREMAFIVERPRRVPERRRGFGAARAAKLATMVVTTSYLAGDDYTGAVQVRDDYDGLLASGCERLHKNWWSARG